MRTLHIIAALFIAPTLMCAHCGPQSPVCEPQATTCDDDGGALLCDPDGQWTTVMSCGDVGLECREDVDGTHTCLPKE